LVSSGFLESNQMTDDYWNQINNLYKPDLNESDNIVELNLQFLLQPFWGHRS